MKEFIEDGLLNSQETLDVLSQRVDELLATEPSIANHEPTCYEEMIPAQMSAPLYELNGQGTLSLVLNRDFELSARLVHTNLTLLKAAAILKGKHLSGPYPDDFDVNLLPDDPFQPGSKIKYRAGEAEAVLYSVGPDGIDNQGQMVYNPENGIVSDGDIILVVK